jgi:hypothetical protein
MSMFQTATKENTFARIALFGPSGGGKTYSALAIASGLGQKIALIDTERRSARKYSDRFAFAVCDLDDRTIGGYLKAIESAAAAKFDVLIIDSMTHAWQELLTEIDNIAAHQFKGNTWGAWRVGRPLQRKFIDAILSYPGHIIATMRSDTEWALEQGNNGKMKPVKVGLKPIQDKGMDYEFDTVLEISTEHIATITKDRTGKFQDQTIDKPGKEFGQAFAAWLGTNPTLAPAPAPSGFQQDMAEAFGEDGNPLPDATADARPKLTELNDLIETHHIAEQTVNGWLAKYQVKELAQLSDQALSTIIGAIHKKYGAPVAA